MTRTSARFVPHRILGVDFSGAGDAGRKIWIAEGRLNADGALLLSALLRACDLPGGGVAPEPALAALSLFIRREPRTVAGCDFPFSLPATMIDPPRWEDFIAGFPARFPDADSFRAWALRQAGGRELRRATDRAVKTPFNSYNLRIYRQTWWGIGSLLQPLLQTGAAIVRPYQPMPRKALPIVIEACPASALKGIGFYPQYKGRAPEHRRARTGILSRLVMAGWLVRPSRKLALIVAENHGGDALDAVIAALVTAHADVQVDADQCERFEGRIFASLADMTR